MLQPGLMMQNSNSDRYSEKSDRWSSHAILISWLSEQDHDARVLDVGTASGLIGRRFYGTGLHLTGVEMDSSYAAAAREYYNEFMNTRIEEAPQELISKQDIVVCADILEHLPNPQQTLSWLTRLQSPGTQFYISIPNVANIWVRLNLLIGKFDYAENGILDRTHLRFFTRKTFLKLLSDVNLYVSQLSVTPIPLTRLSPFFSVNPLGIVLHRILAAVTRVFPTLLGYQFIARTFYRPGEPSDE